MCCPSPFTSLKRLAVELFRGAELPLHTLIGKPPGESVKKGQGQPSVGTIMRRGGGEHQKELKETGGCSKGAPKLGAQEHPSITQPKTTYFNI